MSNIVPLISSGTKGPLGVLHLPRLWLKVSLDAVGKLHPDYPAIGHGYDQMVIDALGLDKEAVSTYISEALPSYPEFEAWVLASSGGALDTAAVEKLNAAITGYEHDADTRGEVLGAAGVPDEGTILDAINLNNLDDWTIFHREVLAR